MRNLAKLPFVYLICLACTPLLGQGTFQNLNFENATIVLDPASPYYPYAVISATAVPGWTAYVGATPQSDLLYNTLPLSSGAVSIYDTPSVLQGRYSLFLEGSTSGDQASVSQTGLVPTTAQSIRFY